MKQATTRATRSRQRRFHRSNSKQQHSSSDMDGEYKDYRCSDYEEDDDISIDEAPLALDSSSPSQVSTTDVVDESKIQVDFCEMTVEEMNQILQWWSSKAWLRDDNQCTIAQNNSLLRLDEEEEPKDDAVLEDHPSRSVAYEDEPNKESACEKEVHPRLVEESSRTKATDVVSDTAVAKESGDNHLSPALANESKNSSSDVQNDEPSAPGVDNFQEDVKATSQAQDDAEGSSQNLLVDQPLPQDVSFFSPIRSTSWGGFSTPGRDLIHSISEENPDDVGSEGGPEELPDFSLRAFSSPEELHQSVTVQHEEVTRLLFQTRDMADQVAALTESSATEDDEDTTTTDNSSFRNDLSEIKLPPPSKLPPRRSNLRRRRRSTIASSPSNPAKDDPILSGQLRLQDHGRLWVLRQAMKVETTLVSRVLVPLLPLPWLLYLLHRPKTFRRLLWTTLLMVFLVSLSTLLWFLVFPKRATALVPLPSLDLFLQQPFYMRNLQCYYAEASSINAVGSLNVEGDQDFGLI